MKCLCATLRHSARLLTRYYEKELQPTGLTVAQFETLSTLHARPGIPQSDLAAALDLDQTTLSRNLRLLIERAWIQRAESTADRRRLSYMLTPQGKKVWRAAVPHWQRAQDQMQQSLGSAWPSLWQSLEHLSTRTAGSKPKDVRKVVES